MSQLRNLLRKIMPRLAKEANKLRDEEARSRWMKMRSITMSPKSLSKACASNGWSMDAYSKWGTRLRKQPRVESLFSKSRKPFRSPKKTKPKKEKKVVQLRRAQPSYGPERISQDLKQLFNINVPPSTAHAILKRKGLISQKHQKSLTKRHLKRYRRPFPGYLQMDFKYVPYPVNGKKLYQLSCVDHHSSWRHIRIYPEKSIFFVMRFLSELKRICPFPILEIQTDNDTAFTDKFSSGVGVTGEHAMDLWCSNNEIVHRLIPVGVKELNGKVENTHKQDDREFYAQGPYESEEKINLNITGYNQRWNQTRRTKALKWKSPNETIDQAYIKALALALFFNPPKDIAPVETPKQRQAKSIKIRTQKKKTYVEKYLQFLEWDSKNKVRGATVGLWPTMSQNFSYLKGNLKGNK